MQQYPIPLREEPVTGWAAPNYFKCAGIYQNLLAQAEKLRRHNRQGSYKTRTRYFEAFQRFLRYLAETYRLENLGNLSGKHLASYVEYMQYRNLSPSTIKTDLAAIRFWHDQIPHAKFALPGNEELDLERRKFGRVDRSWSTGEVNRMLAKCLDENHEDFAACIVLARYAALRLHEVLRLDTATARAALQCGCLTIKGKGGKVRWVPINHTVTVELERLLLQTAPGQKLFVPKGKQTHVVRAELQSFILIHKREVQDKDSRRPLTFHGLRHTCAAEWYQRLVSEGKTELEARLQVSKWLGHERDDVTKVYLAGLPQARQEEGGGVNGR